MLHQPHPPGEQHGHHTLLDLPRLGQFPFECGDFGDGGCTCGPPLHALLARVLWEAACYTRPYFSGKISIGILIARTFCFWKLLCIFNYHL